MDTPFVCLYHPKHQRVILSCFPSTIKHRNFYFRVFSPTSSLGLKCLCLLQRGSFIGLFELFSFNYWRRHIYIGE